MLRNDLSCSKSLSLPHDRPVWYWRSHGLNELADVPGDLVDHDEDFIVITQSGSNGGTTALSERVRSWTLAKTVLGVTAT